MNVFKELNSITDPLEFKGTKVPRLLELDSLLRCHICKEFLIAPMLTNCGHTFCSVCIRKYLIHTSKCPMCSKELRESNLSRNVLLEQVVMTYKDLRPEVLEHLRLGSDESPISRTQYEEKRSLPQEELSQGTTPVVIDLDEEDYKASSHTSGLSDEEIVFLEETRKRKPETKPSIDSLFKRQKSEPPKDEKNFGVCPICTEKFPLEVLQSTHIDECLSNPQAPSVATSKSSLSSPQKVRPSSKSSTPIFNHFQSREPKNDLKKMTKLDYSSLSTSALKLKLSKLELPTHGSRSQLETRYNEYLTLWNANCDSVQPKDLRVLRKQLVQWENTLKMKVSNGGTKMEREGWEDLIAKARASAKRAREQKVDEKDEPN